MIYMGYIGYIGYMGYMITTCFVDNPKRGL
jgi:hypothetical protein